MSVFISSLVWRSPIGNPTLKLILLALADMANDEGIAWPSVRSLAIRCELAESTIRANLAAAEELHILTKQPRITETGRATSNLFEISVPMLENLSAPTLRQSEGSKSDPPGAGGSPSGSRRGDPPGAGGGTHREPDPLKHQIETSDRNTIEPPQAEPVLFDEPEPAPDFPVESIRQLWNRFVPDLPKCSAIKGARFRAIRARHRELKTLADWQAFFESIQASDFLTGRANTGRKWKASIDWCTEPANFTKIRENLYANRTTRTDASNPDTWSKFDKH